MHNMSNLEAERLQQQIITPVSLLSAENRKQFCTGFTRIGQY